MVQQRLRAALAYVVAGRALRYDETALIPRNQLITMDLAWAPLVSPGTVTAVICSAVETAGKLPADSLLARAAADQTIASTGSGL